jgi:hypothetical protein
MIIMTIMHGENTRHETKNMSAMDPTKQLQINQPRNGSYNKSLLK